MAYDFDLLVIGAGSGGVRAARFAASFGAKVAIIEERHLGGTCVNVGCIPKKLFSYASHYYEDFEQATSFGWTTTPPQFNWQTLIQNKNAEISRLNGVYGNLLNNSGVTLLEGHGQIIDAHKVKVNATTYSAKYILIAVGGKPYIPDIEGKEFITTSNEAFYLEHLPKRCLMVGGGYIAVEFASIFNGLGADTTLIYRKDFFLRGFDLDIRKHLAEEMTKKGVKLQFNTDIKRIQKVDTGYLVTFKDDTTLETDLVFYATGRIPLLDNLGLENTQVQLTDKGYIAVDSHYATHEPSIFAIGDVIGQIELTPVSLAQGMALTRHLFKPDTYKAVDLNYVATAVFSSPNIGTVGLSEQQALAAGHSIEVFESTFRPLKLTLGKSTEKTYMKLIVDKTTDKVLGCHMLGDNAGEITQGLAIALKAGATKQLFDETIGIHPTTAEEFVTMRTPRA